MAYRDWRGEARRGGGGGGAGGFQCWGRSVLEQRSPKTAYVHALDSPHCDRRQACCCGHSGMTGSGPTSLRPKDCPVRPYDSTSSHSRDSRALDSLPPGVCLNPWICRTLISRLGIGPIVLSPRRRCARDPRQTFHDASRSSPADGLVVWERPPQEGGY